MFITGKEESKHLSDNFYLYKLTMEKADKQFYKDIPYWSWLLIHCPNCETEWESAYRLWWYKWLNIVLLFLWIIPGVLYFIRRCLNCVCLCKNCHKEELWEINWDTKLIEKLKKIQKHQNICYFVLIFALFLIVVDIIIRFS